MERMETPRIVSDLYTSTSKQTILKFHDLLKTCAGPLGKFHILQNGCGGHVTLTSSSSRLLSALSLSHPELKLIAASVQTLLSQYYDCGLFMACTCLHIIQNSLELGIHFSTLNLLYGKFVKYLVDYMTAQDSTACIKADFTNISIMIAYVRSVVLSKSLATLTDYDCDHIALLIVRAFIDSIPDSPALSSSCLSTGIFVVALEKKHIIESHLLHGLLLEYPELSPLRGRVDLKLKTTMRANEEDNKNGPNISENGRIRVALITCSMSGDLEEIVEAVFEVTQAQCADFQNMIMCKLAAFCDELNRLDVGLILCQKVIHPNVKAMIRLKGILYVERLGSQMIPYLQDLTGAKPIASFVLPSGIGDHLGHVDSVEHIILTDKSFLCLKRKPSPVVTLIVCEQMEERLSEVKNCVMTALHGLRSLAKEKRLLFGGGCWQTHCSYQLKYKVINELCQLSEELHCSEAQILSSLAAFVSSLHHWLYAIHSDSSHLMVDPVSHHCWKPQDTCPTLPDSGRTHCCCGMKSAPKYDLDKFSIIHRKESALLQSQPEMMVISADVVDNMVHSKLVLDNYNASKEALLRSIFTAGLVLSIDKYIVDNN